MFEGKVIYQMSLSDVLHTLPVFSFSCNPHKQLNGDLKGITLVMLAVHEQVALMSSS